MNVSTISSDFAVSVELRGTYVEFMAADHPYREELRLIWGLRITELIYHAAEDERLDYVEPASLRAVPLDLMGLPFSDGEDRCSGGQ